MHVQAQRRDRDKQYAADRHGDGAKADLRPHAER
jgi:hypothetical protein